MKEIKIIPLSKNNLSEAISLVKSIFPYREDQKKARINLIESLSLKNSGKSYWVAVDSNDKIVGLTGLYLDAKDKNVVWLGWFGVHPEQRRQGIGNRLLRFTIDEAKRREFKTMKIYTSTDKGARAARRLYESFGYRKINSCRVADKIHYIKDLNTDDANTGQQAH
jgi:RimJ/RimL family protein N-acetyltransferase